MRVAALTLAGIKMNSLEDYRNSLLTMLKQTGASLVVLPAYSSLLVGFSTAQLKPPVDFFTILKDLTSGYGKWLELFLDLHASAARELEIYLVPGTYFFRESGCIFHSTCCFDPEGRVIVSQKQTHLTREEREAGLCRGEALNFFTVGELKAGLIIGNDARHPETGRILALNGADIILHCGALEAGFNCWPQAAGIWAQVQQNQFWAVEAQLSGKLADRSFGAAPIVHGPCEITPGLSGYLARGYPGDSYAAAWLDEPARQELKQKYPLLELLNPEAYSELGRN
ncbi:MAG: nitrilase-related carbon-nitrogen hydrolase [Bacillota bacterium]|nr:nitrilase-related carbon-nitrogen hydrolase [Bacillota bacterium]